MRPASFTLLVFSAACLLAQNPKFDLVIAGGRIVDGSGNPWYYGDVAITGDSITAIGKIDPSAAVRRLDARGMVVAPGFIDTHTHSRRGIFEDPSAQNYIRQGVTTLIEGPDGSSPVPIAPFLAKVAETKIAPNFATL